MRRTFESRRKARTTSERRVPTGMPALTTPRFYLTGRQPLRPEVILLAVLAAIGAMAGILFAMGHGHARFISRNTSAGGATSAGRGAGSDDDSKDDDPNQIDTIVLGDPSEAPVPARAGNHVSPVHPTILIILPRTGDQVGMIPDSAAGRLLYAWLAAFNGSNSAALAAALPSAANDSAASAQMQLRKETGGFNLVSAKEVQPGVLVFRLRDQTPAGVEALGTLQVRPDSSPACIASFSLRSVPSPQ